MKIKLQSNTKLFYFAIILITIILLIFLFLNKEKPSPATVHTDKKSYTTDILEKRNKKDAEITDSTVTRFNQEEREHFIVKGLQYFSHDENYRVLTEFITDTSTPIFQMPTTTDRKPNYRIYGYARFNIRDTLCKLTVYQNVDFKNSAGYDNTLFVPFNDNTNGLSTYGGGRYMDIEIQITDSIRLDFNEAYNPYCAYSSRWSCPLVPFENDLNVSIFAGEKRYK